jgi:hypothetical protein
MSDKLKESRLTTEMLFMFLDQHRAKIYEDKIIINEATKIMNYIYKLFKISVPSEIEYRAPEGLLDAINEVGAEWISDDVDTIFHGN